MPGIVLDVDPRDFLTASDHAGSVARAIASAGATLRSGLSGSSQMAGSDPSGVKWATQYDDVAADAISGIDALENAFGQIAAGLSVTGLNYATADWLSSGESGHAPGYTVPSLPELACSAAPPSAAGGSRSSDIPGWEYVANFIGDMWPDGDTGKLRHAKSVWNAFADDLDAVHGAGSTKIMAVLAETRTPEQGAIESTVTTVRSKVSALAKESRNLATAAGDLADQIDMVHLETERVLQDLLQEIGATAVIGVGLTLVTAGLSDAAAGLAAGGEVAAAVARILSFIAELGSSVSRVVATVARAAGPLGEVVGLSDQMTIRIVTIAGDSVVSGVGGAVSNVGATLITDPSGDLEDAALDGFVGGASLGSIAGTLSMRRVYVVQLRKLKSAFAMSAAGVPTPYALYGSLTEREWFRRYFAGLTHADFHAQWKWPGDNGFVPGTAVPNTVPVGHTLSRITARTGAGGVANGEFATLPGTPFSDVAMPPDRLSTAFTTVRYEVVKPLPASVLQGPIAPWFEQPGMGVQYYFEGGINRFVDAGYLKVVP
ncbi:TNT domain-containing protein [Frondihabitans australicus]|uniref:Uncharacterized protein DUF4237 n=1 Tax=Frondihabitans australicus TaxID=386892 RepID=A0A495IMA3_9MICO|nr:TNT domain-containing protein [Frondihabitans australicus]RKR76391.1 uncharacterized protein DUF4237 [Frondihabitans australicus]